MEDWTDETCPHCGSKNFSIVESRYAHVHEIETDYDFDDENEVVTILRCFCHDCNEGFSVNEDTNEVL